MKQEMENQYPYIKNIFIKNLFNSKDIFWELHKDVNILGGINGSGKSTILRSIGIALNPRYDESFEVSSLFDYVEVEFTTGVKLIIGREDHRGNNRDFQAGFFIESFVIGVDVYDEKNQLVEDGRQSLSFLRSFNVDYLSSAETQIISEEVVKGIGNKEVKTTLDLLLFNTIQKRNEILAESFSENEESISSLNKLNQKLFSSIQNIFSDTEKELNNKTSFSFIHKPSGDEISCYKLSTGEKQMLLILLTAFNTKSEPCVLIMDEPDLGIHIDWKRKIISTIRELNSNAQIILSTHSPSMIEGWFDKVKEINEITQYTEDK